MGANGWKKEQPKSSVTGSMLAGSLSGALSATALQPLEVVKTRQQLPPSRSVRQIVSVLVEQKGVLGLWTGLSASLYRTVPGVGLYFGILHTLQATTKSDRWLSHPGFESMAITPAFTHFFQGATARGLAATVLLPFTVVKARIESGLFQYSNVRQALILIATREGAQGLFRGLGATLLRDVPYSGTYFAAYSYFKQKFQPHIDQLGLDESGSTALNAATSACVAGGVASAITHPFDVAKTTTQVQQSKHLGIVDAFKTIYQENGLQSFYRGFPARWLRRTLSATISWTVYESVTTWYSAYTQQQ
eukprot:m.85077 g.85077  ORF g.85077 m.85077 type:complete len:305 (+) comp12773_c0_seq4:116-1030(+)